MSDAFWAYWFIYKKNVKCALIIGIFTVKLCTCCSSWPAFMVFARPVADERVVVVGCMYIEEVFKFYISQRIIAGAMILWDRSCMSPGNPLLLITVSLGLFLTRGEHMEEKVRGFYKEWRHLICFAWTVNWLLYMWCIVSDVQFCFLNYMTNKKRCLIERYDRNVIPCPL